jgi:hypothetical protein
MKIQNKSLTEIYQKLIENNIICSLRGNALRVSPYVYNDISKLTETLIKHK